MSWFKFKYHHNWPSAQAAPVPAEASSSSGKAKASTSEPDCTNSYTSADCFDWDYAPLDSSAPQPQQPGQVVPMTEAQLKTLVPHATAMAYTVKWEPGGASTWPWQLTASPQQPEFQMLYPTAEPNHCSTSSPAQSAPIPPSKPRRRPRSRPTMPITYGTSNTWNQSARTYYSYPDFARIAQGRVSPRSRRTNESAGNATGNSRSTNSSLSLTQWFDTLMGLSGRLTPRRSPDQATMIERVGPEGLKAAFISGHLRRCTQTNECRVLSSTWFSGPAQRCEGDLSSYASMILAAHRRLSKRPSGT